MQEDCPAAGRRRAESLVNGRRCADVETARRILGDHHPRRRGQLPGSDEFLLVATTQSCGRDIGAWGGDAVVVQETLCVGACMGPVDPAPLDPRLVPARGEHDVLGERELRNQPLGRPVFRNESHGPGDLEPSAKQVYPSGHRPQELALPIALDRRHSHDLTAVNRKGHGPYREPDAVFAGYLHGFPANQRRAEHRGAE